MRKINWKFILNNKGFFDIVLPVLAIAGIGAGVAEGVNALTSQPKPPAAPATPAASQAAAQNTAEAAQLQARKTFLSAGGQTDYTGGLGILTGSDLKAATLTGS